MGTSQSQQSGYDPGEPDGKSVSLYIGLFMIGLLATFYFSTMLYHSLSSNELSLRETESGTADSLAKVRAYEDEALFQLAWRDKEKSLVKIPITLAMAQVVEAYKK